tara:strand:+ start:20623 stop:21393 length:771 start_codon:yes stop_codon:yes gene_type:complete
MKNNLTKEKIIKIEKIIIDAGKKIKKSYLDRDMKIHTKSNNEYFTNIDVDTEIFLISRLKKIFIESNFISEETSKENLDSAGYTWIIDPIDGTNNFIRMNPHFCISVSLKFNRRTILGIIHDPIKNETFKAVRNEGSYLNNEKIFPSETKELKNAIVSLGLVKSQPKIMARVKKYHKIYPYLKSLRNSGSAALDLAYLACGRVDACWLSGLNIWDYDAGILIALESGIKIKKNKNYSDLITGSNKYIYKEFLRLTG